jgi:type IV secretory pathway VirB10-like protein
MKIIGLMFLTFAVAGFTAAAEPEKKPAPDSTKPVLKKPDSDPSKPPLKKLPPDPNKPAVKKPAPDGTQPVVKKPGGKKPDAGVTPGVKKPGANNAKDEFTGILNRCDTDKNGSVSLDEFKSNSGAKDPASLEKWFTSHDFDKDGQLTATDFGPHPKK